MSKQINYDQELTMICKGNADAMRFLVDITTVLHAWDDLVDKDNAISPAELNKVFWTALVDLPRNTFYGQNFVALNALLMNAILNWECATDMERYPQMPEDEPIAFIIRSCYLDLVTFTAMLCGGKAHAEEVLPTLRRFWHDEGLVGYRANLKKEMEARDGL